MERERRWGRRYRGIREREASGATEGEEVRVLCLRYIYYDPVIGPRWDVWVLYLPRQAL